MLSSHMARIWAISFGKSFPPTDTSNFFNIFNVSRSKTNGLRQFCHQICILLRALSTTDRFDDPAKSEACNRLFCYRWQPVNCQLRGPELQQLQLGEQSFPRREKLADAFVWCWEHDGLSWRQQWLHLRLFEMRSPLAEVAALSQVNRDAGTRHTDRRTDGHLLGSVPLCAISISAQQARTRETQELPCHFRAYFPCKKDALRYPLICLSTFHSFNRDASHSERLPRKTNLSSISSQSFSRLSDDRVVTRSGKYGLDLAFRRGRY